MTVVRRPVGPTATMWTVATIVRWRPSARRRRLSAECRQRRRTCPGCTRGSERASATSATALREEDPDRTGESVAVTSILQPRSQLTVSASARRESTSELRGRLTCSTGATFSGGGQALAGTQPTPAGEAGSKRSTRLLFVSATYTLAFAADRDRASAGRARPGRPRAEPHLAR